MSLYLNTLAHVTSPPSVLFVLPNLQPGGAEKAVVNLANALSVDSVIALASVASTGSLHEILDSRVHLRYLGGRTRTLFALPRLVWQLRPTIVFSTIWDLNVIVLLLRWTFPARTKVIVREAVAPLQDIASKAAFSWLWRIAYKFTYPFADAVVVLSRQMKDSLCQNTKVRSESVEVIYNAVSAQPDAVLSSERPRGEAIQLVTLGRLEWQKGYDLLIRAIPEVLASFPSVRLTIYGEGEQKQHLQELVSQLGLQDCIDMPGYTNEPLSVLSRADLFVVSSRYEGMSNAMLEALSCGLPVLSTRNNTGAEEVIVSGIDGFLIETPTAEGMAAALCSAVSRLPTLTRDTIRARCMQRFSIERQLACYTALFKRVASD